MACKSLGLFLISRSYISLSFQSQRPVLGPLYLTVSVTSPVLVSHPGHQCAPEHTSRDNLDNAAPRNDLLYVTKSVVHTLVFKAFPCLKCETVLLFRFHHPGPARALDLIVEAELIGANGALEPSRTDQSSPKSCFHSEKASAAT